MKTSTWSTLFFHMLYLFLGIVIGYILDAKHKAERLYDLKAPHIIYRDTCFYQFNPVNKMDLRIEDLKKQAILDAEIVPLKKHNK